MAKNVRGEELSPEQATLAEKSSLVWARVAAGLCPDCGAPATMSQDNPEPGPRCGDNSGGCRMRKIAFDMAAIFEVRTRAVAAGSGDVTIAHPHYRVSWHEVGLSGPNDRVAFQPAFESALKRRGLLGVLRGTISSVEWVQRHPKQRRIIKS